MEFLVMMLTLSAVLCEQMDWGDNPDLVKESDPFQGREHIKRLVALVGDTIDLECQVLLAIPPISEIRWRCNGKQIHPSENSTVVRKDGEVFVEDHYIIDITEEMSAKVSTVTCEYGQEGLRVEADMHIFTLEIEAVEKVCETCVGDMKLVFKETEGSISTLGGANVDTRIRSKIAKMTNVQSDDITYENDEYSVTLPIDNVENNPGILAMKPKYIIGGKVTDSLVQCKCGSARTNSGMTIDISIVVAALAAIITTIF